jgi:hypothetical protein
LGSRVTRWYIFKPKIPIWVNFGMKKVGIFYGILEYFIVILYILRAISYAVAISYVSPIWIYCVKMATLLRNSKKDF